MARRKQRIERVRTQAPVIKTGSVIGGHLVKQILNDGVLIQPHGTERVEKISFKDAEDFVK